MPGSRPALKLPWCPASCTHGYFCLFLCVWKNGVHWTMLRSFLQPMTDCNGWTKKGELECATKWALKISHNIVCSSAALHSLLKVHDKLGILSSARYTFKYFYYHLSADDEFTTVCTQWKKQKISTRWKVSTVAVYLIRSCLRSLPNERHKDARAQVVSHHRRESTARRRLSSSTHHSMAHNVELFSAALKFYGV